MTTQMIRNFIQDETGTTMVEYGLIASLISVAAIAAMQAVGVYVDQLFTKVRVVLIAMSLI